MNIKRVNCYDDSRFSKHVLAQHGCFLIDDEPYEIEIISHSSAIIRGQNRQYYEELIEEFRFYAPHIYQYYDDHHLIKKYKKPQVIDITLKDIQPSQFYINQNKIQAIQSFIHHPEDIIIQVIEYNGRYISLDGHTRLYYAALLGFEKVKAVYSESESYIYDFVKEAQKRKIYTPSDMILLNQNEYEEKWYAFCDEYFQNKEVSK